MKKDKPRKLRKAFTVNVEASIYFDVWGSSLEEVRECFNDCGREALEDADIMVHVYPVTPKRDVTKIDQAVDGDGAWVNVADLDYVPTDDKSTILGYKPTPAELEAMGQQRLFE